MEDINLMLDKVRPEIKKKIEERYAEQLNSPETMSRSTVEKITHDIDEAKGVTGNTYIKTFYLIKRILLLKKKLQNLLGSLAVE